MPTQKIKKYLIILLVVLFSILIHVNFVSGIEVSPTITPTPIQDSIIDNSGNVEITDEALKLEIKIINQEFISRKITIELTINPSIDSGRAAIDWIYNKDLFTIVGETREVLTLNKDQVIKITKDFIPITKYQRSASFDFKITARVTATAYDINYLSTRILSLTINQKYEITPLLDNYNTIKTLSLYGAVILIIVSSSALIALFAYLLNKFLIYLNTDEGK